jgi:dTDP-glucose pyrophosphorylase
MIMPMAGRGSRFAREGIVMPKPLVELAGKPFFWWATESLRRAVPLREMIFVVLQEHVESFGIDGRIRQFYPSARVVVLPEVTAGAAETAAIGVRELSADGPIAINDSDHAFSCSALAPTVAALGSGADAALLCFRSQSPAYSYAALDEGGAVVGTVEKDPVSPFAIAGCYLFAAASRFTSLYESYRLDCRYDELFLSGIYDRLIQTGGHVEMILADRHLSFGTPEELACIDQAALASAPEWIEAL